ncbi:transglycosylase family protein [Streptomyces sp. NPDC051776]|uniref:LysM peptidoglycan-binding domain-containing protein n=1 Tax=Streptomyces sp. NPDC051776 TaxID=3155414 RepID=UPI003413B27E
MIVLATIGALSAGAAWPAQAEDGTVWDRLAVCESGGNWRADTGNGYSGGLQFSDTTWRAYGGGAFASRASQASRAQQISVAQRTLASQGWGAWPACSASLGLRSTALDAAASAPDGTGSTSGTSSRGRPRLSPSGEHGDRGGNRRNWGRGHVVKPGETLSGIASVHGVGWMHVFRLNRGVIGDDPDLIFPGVRLVL